MSYKLTKLFALGVINSQDQAIIIRLNFCYRYSISRC